MTKPKAIFIDWNGTLSDSMFWGHLQNSQSTERRELYKKWEKAMFSDNKEEIQDWMRGESTTEDWVRKVALKTSTDYELVLAEFITGAKSMSLAQPKVIDFVRELRCQGVKVFIATDNMDSFSRWTVPSLGLVHFFDGIINSYNQGALKKDLAEDGKSRFFEPIFARFKIDPNDSIMIDDSDDKGGSISSLGIKYQQVKSSKEVTGILYSYILSK